MMDEAISEDGLIQVEYYDRCVACHSPLIRFWRSKNYVYSTKRHASKSFSIYRCQACGTGFLNPPPHDALLKQIYAYSGHGLRSPVDLATILDKERKWPNSTLDAERIVATAHALVNSSTKNALDVGSGYGFYTRELIGRGYRTTSINPAKYENEVFKEMLGHEPIPVYFHDFSTEARFDIVLMSQVLEHIKTPLAAVRKVVGLLAEGGIFACVVPNFKSFSVKMRGITDNGCLWVPEHVNYFTLAGLSRCFASCGLRVVHSDFVTRIPCDALSRRVGLSGNRLLQCLVRIGQKPFLKLVDRLGCGLCINMYAIKD